MGKNLPKIQQKKNQIQSKYTSKKTPDDLCVHFHISKLQKDLKWEKEVISEIVILLKMIQQGGELFIQQNLCQANTSLTIYSDSTFLSKGIEPLREIAINFKTELVDFTNKLTCPDENQLSELSNFDLQEDSIYTYFIKDGYTKLLEETDYMTVQAKSLNLILDNFKKENLDKFDIKYDCKFECFLSLEGIPNCLMSILSLTTHSNSFNECTYLILELLAMISRRNPLALGDILDNNQKIVRKNLEKYHPSVWAFTLSQILKTNCEEERNFSMSDEQYDQLTSYLVKIYKNTKKISDLNKGKQFYELDKMKENGEIDYQTAEIQYKAKLTNYFILEAFNRLLLKMHDQRKLSSTRINLGLLKQDLNKKKKDFFDDHTLKKKAFIPDHTLFFSLELKITEVVRSIHLENCLNFLANLDESLELNEDFWDIGGDITIHTLKAWDLIEISTFQSFIQYLKDSLNMVKQCSRINADPENKNWKVHMTVMRLVELVKVLEVIGLGSKHVISMDNAKETYKYFMKDYQPK